MDRFSFLNAVHAEYIDNLYEKYKKYPDSVDTSWRSFFQGYDFASQSYNGYALQELAEPAPESQHAERLKPLL